MIGGDVRLNVNFALSKPLLGAVAMLSQNLMNAVLQWNIKLLTNLLTGLRTYI